MQKHKLLFWEIVIGTINSFGVSHTRDKILFSAGKNVGYKVMREMVSKIITVLLNVECILKSYVYRAFLIYQFVSFKQYFRSTNNIPSIYKIYYLLLSIFSNCQTSKYSILITTVTIVESQHELFFIRLQMTQELILNIKITRYF